MRELDLSENHAVMLHDYEGVRFFKISCYLTGL